MTKYDCIPFESLKEGEMVLAFGRHAVRWDFDFMGEPAYAFVEAEDNTDTLQAENARLREALDEIAKRLHIVPLPVMLSDLKPLERIAHKALGDTDGD